MEIAVKVLGSRMSRKKETRERRSVGEDSSWRSKVGRCSEREAAQLDYYGEQHMQIETRSGSMPWKGGGESRQVKRSANSTNKSKSNVITR